MRRGYQGKDVITSPIIDKLGGQVIGISLGWDHVAEHEWGISKIRSSFGIPGISRGTVGADARTITKLPKNLRFVDNLNGHSYLIFRGMYDLEESDMTAINLDRILGRYPDEELSTAWDEYSFGICMRNEEMADAGKSVLGQIYQAILENDAMIYLGGRAVFGNCGLVIAIRSRMPVDALEAMKAGDEDRLNLLEADEKTDIKQKLEKANKRYFALSPKWAASSEDEKTDYPVVYWLNPQEQDKNNYGWFTVKDLLEWIDGKGPIPIKAD